MASALFRKHPSSANKMLQLRSIYHSPLYLLEKSTSILPIRLPFLSTVGVAVKNGAACVLALCFITLKSHLVTGFEAMNISQKSSETSCVSVQSVRCPVQTLPILCWCWPVLRAVGRESLLTESVWSSANTLATGQYKMFYAHVIHLPQSSKTVSINVSWVASRIEMTKSNIMIWFSIISA